MTPPPLFISELDCRTIMRKPGAMAEAIGAVRQAMIAEAKGDLKSHPRVHVAEPGAPATERSGRCVRALPAIGKGLGAAVRVYTMNKDGDPYRPAPCELIIMLDPEHLTLRSVIEDYSLHGARTAAPTGVATDVLAPRGARRLAVIGSGRHAASQVSAIASVRRLSEVRVFSRNPVRREGFAREMEALVGCPAKAYRSPEEAVAGAEIVTVATNSKDPALRGSWLQPGMHINSIAARELDEEVVLRSRVFPDSAAGLLHHEPRFTPFPELVAAGRLTEADLSSRLDHVLAGLVPGRGAEDEITLFVSTGSATWDLAIGRWIDDQARALGLGHPLIAGGNARSGEGFMTPPPSLDS